MSTDQAGRVDALVIFGATGDLAKLETFPALVGLVERGVLDVPVVGVAKSGWGLDQFRDYATASLKLNNLDPASPAAVKLLQLLRYVDGDLDDPATYQAMSGQMGQAAQTLFYPRCRRRCSAASPRASPPPDARRAAGSWWRSRSATTWPVPARRPALAVRLAGHGRGGLAGRRPGARRRGPCAPVQKG